VQKIFQIQSNNLRIAFGKTFIINQYCQYFEKRNLRQWSFIKKKKLKLN